MDGDNRARKPVEASAPDRDKAKDEAQARIIWGDDPGGVAEFLAENGYSRREASGLVEAMQRDRAATVRGMGIRKIVIGSALLAVLAAAILFMCIVRHVLVELVAIPGAMGIYGLWNVVAGTLMILAPRRHEGDLAEQSE